MFNRQENPQQEIKFRMRTQRTITSGNQRRNVLEEHRAPISQKEGTSEREVVGTRRLTEEKRREGGGPAHKESEKMNTIEEVINRSNNVPVSKVGIVTEMKKMESGIRDTMENAVNTMINAMFTLQKDITDKVEESRSDIKIVDVKWQERREEARRKEDHRMKQREFEEKLRTWY